MIKINEGAVDLLRRLSLTFGPTGAEEEAANAVADELRALGAEYTRDRRGNIYVRVAAKKDGAPRVMISAHLDEVGFIISEIDDGGYVRFECLGGIDPAVLCGKRVVFNGKCGKVRGVIASKAIHHQTAEERKKVTRASDMYVDVGSVSREETEKLLELGDCGTFDSEFVRFGTDGKFVKGKAIDDRLGCAVMLLTLERLLGGEAPEAELIFAFTVCEEIGRSGGQLAAQKFAPDYAVILETTAVADLPNVEKHARVAALGDGGAISLADRSTIYDRELVEAITGIGAKHGIPVQVKKYVSGGNDAGHVHKSCGGVRVLAMSAPTRYLHSPACVASLDDYAAMTELLSAFLTEYSF